MTHQSHSLAVLDKFRMLLAKAETLEEVTDLRSQADAVRVWAKSAAMGLEAQNKAAELKLRAERKAGELLAALNLRGGDRKSNGHDDRLNLPALGINQSQSKRWQKEAAVPEAEFVQYVKRAGQLGEEVTAAGLLRLSRKGSGNAVPRKANTPQQGPQKALPPKPIVRLQESPMPRNGRNDQEATDIKRAEQLALVQEISDHLALLRSLLAPVCNGEIENLLPIHRQAIQRYLAESARLLALLGADQGRDLNGFSNVSPPETRLAWPPDQPPT